MKEKSMFVGVCRLSLHFPGSASLKDKRQGVRRIVDRVRSKFNVAISEVGGQDTWQRALLGICVVSNEGGHAREMIDAIISFVDQLYVAQLLDRQVDVVRYGEDWT